MLSLPPPSRAPSDVFGVSASTYGGPPQQVALAPPRKRRTVNYFILPVFILHLIGIACLVALFYYLRFTDLFPYRKREFWCNDPTLMFRNLSTDRFMYLSDALLYVICFLVPPVIIILGEIAFWLFSTKPRKTVYANCRDCKVHLFTRRVLRFIAVFYFGALIVCVFTDTIKLITGFQRPYFLTLCNVTRSLCHPTFEFSAQPQPGIAEELQLTDPIQACINRQDIDPAEFRYAWLTFPSLHAVLSSYSMIFAAVSHPTNIPISQLYIIFMVSLRGAPLLRPFLVFLLLTFTLFASFCRINGYKNHWRDIWAGWLLGAITAVYLAWNVIWFQEVYHLPIERTIVEERQPPFFNWFKLPRVRQPSRDYSVYDDEPTPPPPQKKRDRDRTYEVTTTTESFHRTIHPPEERTIVQEQQYAQEPQYDY